MVDQFTRECVTLLADHTLSGEKVAVALDKALLQRGAPESITVDNGTEFTSKALDHWAYRNSLHLDFTRPGRPVENPYIESFNPGPSNFVAGVERQAPRRVPERRGLLLAGGCAAQAVPLASGLQPSPAALCARRSNAGVVRSFPQRPCLRHSLELQ